MNKILFYNGLIYLNKNKFGYGFEIANQKFNKLFNNKNQINFDEYKHKVNLNKKLVIPGLIDAHNHFLMAANDFKKINLNNINSIDDLIKKIQAYICENKNLKYVFLEGLNQEKIRQKITRQTLDKINSQIPIFIYFFDRHSMIVNTCGLVKLKLFKKNIKSIHGGLIELDNNKNPNGLLKENACNYVRDFIENNDDTNELENMIAFEQVLLKYGITTIATCDIAEINYLKRIKLYEKFQENNIIEIYHQCPIFNFDNFENFFENLNNSQIKNIIQIKIFLDGSINSKTAFLSLPYIDSNKNYGILNYQKNDLKNIILKINQKQKQAMIHCIGDQASSIVWQVLNEINEKNSDRNGIIHFQISNLKLIKQIAKNNVLICVQPCFIEDDLNVLNKFVNKKLLEFSYAYKSVYDLNNKIVCFGTDAPICDFDPWKNIYYSICNKQLNHPYLQWNQNQNFDIYQAIECYTKNAAFFLKKENELGEIKQGFQANFIVLNQNIFNLKNKKDILKTKIINSYIKGKKVV